MDSEIRQLAAFACRLADHGGDIARHYYRTPFEVAEKLDETPVTIADRDIERKLRALIQTERSEDGICGEEFGTKESRNGYQWILDPIDGTKSFTIGRPIFGSLIALWKDGAPLIGIIDQPVLGERWVGVRGEATLFNGKPVRTASCSVLSEAKIATTAPDMFKGERTAILENIVKSSRYVNWGGDCYSYGLLAGGWLDMVIEAELKLHDYAALVPVIEGAGGMVTDWNGEPLCEDSDGTVLALGDKSLWPAARALVRGDGAA